MKLFPIIWMVFYWYGLIGAEVLNSTTSDLEVVDSPYLETTQKYEDFNSFYGAEVLLFQVLLEAEWDGLIFHYAYIFNDVWKSALFFITFHLIISLILLSLIRGIVWEIFIVVDQESGTLADQAAQEPEKAQPPDGLDKRHSKS